jgi:uncharacterized membrane protein
VDDIPALNEGPPVRRDLPDDLISRLADDDLPQDSDTPPGPADTFLAEVVHELQARVRSGDLKANNTSVTASLRRRHSGPLPPPDDFIIYESALPGSAERILAMAEKEQSHRHEIDRQISRSDVREHRRIGRGQLFGLLVVICCCLVAAFAIYHQQPVVASVVMGTTIVALAGVFAAGRIANTGVVGSAPDTPTVE